ncbi:hypothetical protein GJ744_000960 [Endocarpon pusillum]|uniref:Dyp-type peroxidase C-terminal domain-containing protein n=1 Tax=Endocarpon pusillum TaxID=364733 RepID=A0A8H7ADC6_9EURO|nr:hypothetical protein GJ744_000960 [Endocarpon pusillum]
MLARAGAPVDITPLKDDEALGKDRNRRNKFSYNPTSQEKCPFAAHTRKTNPRSDLKPEDLKIHRIIRRGISYGPEVSPDEAATKRTTQDRGLLFACYQSNIANGFKFIQQSRHSFPGTGRRNVWRPTAVGWANNVGFPFNKPQQPGFDAIIGQTNNVGLRTMSGSNPNSVSAPLNLNEQWVGTHGREYLFVPSISALRDTFALKQKTELR